MQAFIRGTTPFKISLKSEAVSSRVIFADCSCPAAKKGQLCKHIWAALVKAEQNHPDFLDGKTELEKSSTAAKGTATTSFQAGPASQAQVDSQAAYKQKQADYRKEQYQKQKQRWKDQKQAKRKAPSPEAAEPPEEIKEALHFFTENGFALELPLNPTVIGFAKKRLSRIFHPDMGGSHDEILKLNDSFETLMTYLKQQATE